MMLGERAKCSGSGGVCFGFADRVLGLLLMIPLLLIITSSYFLSTARGGWDFYTATFLVTAMGWMVAVDSHSLLLPTTPYLLQPLSDLHLTLPLI